MPDSLESEQLDFLLNILQSVSDSNSDPNVVYPLLKQNLMLLNDRLIEVLNVWVRSTSAQVHRTAQKSIARTVSDFGDLIQEFPLGNKAVNMELSIVCYGLALEIFTVVEDAEIWAYIQSRLGTVYKNRIGGHRADNLEQSIEFHRAALEVLTKQDLPIQWAATQHGLGNAYSERIRGNRAANLEKSIQCYTRALEVLTK